jgi:hypothetical protein
MALDVTAARAPVILELAACGAECITQRHVWILMRRGSRAGPANRDDLVRKPDLDVQIVQAAVAAVARWRRNDDVTMADACVELLEPRDQRADPRSQRGRAHHVSEGDLQRELGCLVAGPCCVTAA